MMIGTEKIIGIVPNLTRKKGLFSKATINLVVTETRMIFALLSDRIIKETFYLTQGKKTLPGSIKKPFLKENLYRQYFDMEPGCILGQDSENFSLQPKNILSIEIVAKPKTNARTPINILKIRHSAGLFEAAFAEGISITAKEARAIFSHAFPDINLIAEI